MTIKLEFRLSPQLRAGAAARCRDKRDRRAATGGGRCGPPRRTFGGDQGPRRAKNVLTKTTAQSDRRDDGSMVDGAADLEQRPSSDAMKIVDIDQRPIQATM